MATVFTSMNQKDYRLGRDSEPIKRIVVMLIELIDWFIITKRFLHSSGQIEFQLVCTKKRPWRCFSGDEDLCLFLKALFLDFLKHTVPALYSKVPVPICLILVLWIRIGFRADPDPAFYLKADPNPDPGSQTNADP
jgi:hypothetical protein